MDYQWNIPRKKALLSSSIFKWRTVDDDDDDDDDDVVVDDDDKTVGNAILHGTFTTNNLVGVRKDSANSAGHFIILRME